MMEDRWLFQSEGTMTDNNLVVHIYRSWTGDEQFQLQVKAATGVQEQTNDAQPMGGKITEITWNENSEPNKWMSRKLRR